MLFSSIWSDFRFRPRMEGTDFAADVDGKLLLMLAAEAPLDKTPNGAADPDDEAGLDWAHAEEGGAGLLDEDEDEFIMESV